MDEIELFTALLRRMNITWELDEAQRSNYQNAMEEALSLLRAVAGNPEADFSQGANRDLFLTCTMYLLEHKRAEFMADYTGELTMLRMTEGFGCGKETSTV